MQIPLEVHNRLGRTTTRRWSTYFQSQWPRAARLAVHWWCQCKWLLWWHAHIFWSSKKWAPLLILYIWIILRTFFAKARGRVAFEDVWGFAFGHKLCKNPCAKIAVFTWKCSLILLLRICSQLPASDWSLEPTQFYRSNVLTSGDFSSETMQRLEGLCTRTLRSGKACALKFALIWASWTF